ncbi:hypothetical protein FPV67DRAFT_205044 [Lyophyllum atratum]|nr:hypothetical protein FPV67DRAFT_205044 [Lyophyllum atratum]
MVVSLLEVADTHVDVYGDFSLQLRMAALHHLLHDSEDVKLAFSMCQALPRIQPNSRWQPVANPVKAHPVSNVQGSISLPEIHPPIFPASSSLVSSPMLESPVPSLSSLLNCTPSTSMSTPRFHPFNLDRSSTINESISQPAITLLNAKPPTLTFSSSMPNLRSASAPRNTSTALPVIAFEDHSFRMFTPLSQSLFSPPSFSPSCEENDYDLVQIGEGSGTLLDVPDIHVQPLNVEQDPVPPIEEATAYPAIISVISQDDLSRLISLSDVGEDPPSPSLFSPSVYTPSPMMGSDFTIAIGAPALNEHPVAEGSSKIDLAPLSPHPTQSSSPLSSPPEIIVKSDGDKFRNIFGVEVQQRPPSPYNKRLRSASNNPTPTMQYVMPSPRIFSDSSRRQPPLDQEIASLTLPSPPKRKSVDVQDTEEVVVVQKKKAPVRKVKAVKAMPAPERTIIVQDNDDSALPRHRWQRGRKASTKSLDKENS